MERAIAAIATAKGRGGIAVIRISGENAVLIASKIFRLKSGKSLMEIPANSAVYGNILSDEDIIDDGIATVFYAPRSFTGEDMVEISCHGGVALTRLVLQSALNAGAAAATAGEFTKRAVLNGKLSLSAAEAIAEVIDAEGERAVKLLSRARNGELYNKVMHTANLLISLNAAILAYIDFPDEDIEELSEEHFLKSLISIKDELSKLMQSYSNYTAIRDGVTVAIVGLPNSGKSSVMNRLCDYERSIVTEIEGTTRDIIEERLSINGILYKLWDTAGVRKSDDIVERIGVERSIDAILRADIILYVISKGATDLQAEKNLISQINDKNTIAVINKNDLEDDNPDVLEMVLEHFEKPLHISAESGEGFESLTRRLSEMGEIADITETAFVINNRQMQLISEANSSIAEAVEMVQNGITPDFVSVAVDEAIDALLVLCGKKAREEVVDEIFKNFCVGK